MQSKVTTKYSNKGLLNKLGYRHKYNHLDKVSETCLLYLREGKRELKILWDLIGHIICCFTERVTIKTKAKREIEIYKNKNYKRYQKVSMYCWCSCTDKFYI